MKAAPAVVLLLVPASLVVAVAFGSVDLGAARLGDALLFRGRRDRARDRVGRARAPGLAGFACGGLLALAGALLQLLLRNPLADPAILGVSGAPPRARSARCCLGAAAAAVTSRSRRRSNSPRGRCSRSR